MGTNIALNPKSFAFLDSFPFKSTEWCKARITALLCLTEHPIFVLLSITRERNPTYLNFSTCFNFFNGTLQTYKTHWTKFFERWRTSILQVMVFIPVMSYAVAKPFNPCWWLDLEEASKTKSSAKTNRLILHLEYCIVGDIILFFTGYDRLD